MPWHWYRLRAMQVSGIHDFVRCFVHHVACKLQMMFYHICEVFYVLSRFKKNSGKQFASIRAIYLKQQIFVARIVGIGEKLSRQ
jgi:hypothetical protein